MADHRFDVRVPDAEFYRRMVKCQAACPVNTDARGYVTAVARGDLERGYRIAREPNPLASMCGRICGAPCEVACRRGDIDEPVAIRPLKRVVTERYGPEARHRLPSGRSEPLLDPSADLDESPAAWSRSMLRRLAAQDGRATGRVALIGAGPSSLAAAHDLALLGHRPVIFEAGPQAGGMIRYGVPSYRVDWGMMDLEIQEIVDLGVEIRYDTPVGKDVTLADLRQEFDAVFVGAGLMKGRDLKIEGHDLDGVIKAVDLLLNFNLGYRVELGQKVIVIGGGDVAMDAARTALRAGQLTAEQEAALAETDARADEEAEGIHDAFDVARTALRLGAVDVRLMALESTEELPASELEIEETLEEGVRVHTRLGPNRILGEGGRVVGLETIAVDSVFDAEGRFAPRFRSGSEQSWECDTVILAIGQAPDLGLLGEAPDIEVGPRGFVVTDPDTGSTSAPDVFAGGDVAHGPRLLIHAVRDGHLAALAIDSRLQGRRIERREMVHWTRIPGHQMPEGWLEHQRQRVPSLPVDRRTGHTQVEVGYSAEEGAVQGLRCLECSINTIFDGDKCILCNGCVDVCPWDCLKIVDLAQMRGDETLSRVVEQHAGVALEDAAACPVGGSLAAMIKDDTACTRCALCAERCPTGAITMESFRFRDELAYGPAHSLPTLDS